jgi:hypothetical protein
MNESGADPESGASPEASGATAPAAEIEWLTRWTERRDAEIAKLGAEIAEQKALREQLIRMEAERWERLVVAEPDPRPEPTRADPVEAEPFRSLLGYAIRGELEELSAQIYTRGEAMYPVVLGLCLTVAGYITLDVCARNPTVADLLKIAEITIRGDVLAGLDEARVSLHISESAVYRYLSHAVLDYEPITEVFPPPEAATLPLLFTGALLAAFCPHDKHWWEYLDQIWDALQTAERTRLSVLPALHLRARRRARLRRAIETYETEAGEITRLGAAGDAAERLR